MMCSLRCSPGSKPSLFTCVTYMKMHMHVHVNGEGLEPCLHVLRAHLHECTCKRNRGYIDCSYVPSPLL